MHGIGWLATAHIALAQAGVHDPERLCEGALKVLGPPRT
jgi:hypothetical protein